jgi:hypothetical protein
MAIAILFYDTRLEGVEAIVAIPAGQTADQTFEAYLIHAAKEQEVADEDLAQWREGYGYDELPIEILPPTILGLPIEKRETIADLLDDSDCI